MRLFNRRNSEKVQEHMFKVYARPHNDVDFVGYSGFFVRATNKDEAMQKLMGNSVYKPVAAVALYN